MDFACFIANRDRELPSLLSLHEEIRAEKKKKKKKMHWLKRQMDILAFTESYNGLGFYHNQTM